MKTTTKKVCKTKLGTVKHNWHKEKVQGCIMLSARTDMKITDTEIEAVSIKLKIPFQSMKNSWKTFQETGGKMVDYRTTTCSGTKKFTPKVLPNTTRNRDVSPSEAAEIILQYMNDNMQNSRELCNKYKITTVQFYSWIHELSISGTILGKTVLDVTEYAKLPVKDVIWFYKHPDTKRKSIKALTDLEKKQYARVATVLLNYLPTVK